MGHMVAGLVVHTNWIRMTQSEMEGSLIHLIGEALDMSSILVLDRTSIIVIIIIILTGGVRRDTCG